MNHLSARMKRLTLSLATIASLALGGLAAGAPTIIPAAANAAASGFHYTGPGYSLQRGFLCLDTRARNGYQTLHCTRRYHRAGVWLVSDDPRCVPGRMDVGGHTTVRGGAAPGHAPAVSGRVSPAPRGISQWAFTGRRAYTLFDPFARSGNKAALSYPWGQCTWYAALRAHDNVSFLGNAGMWPMLARWRGLPTGSVPRVGATAVFQRGVQGAGFLGHAGHVEAVYPGGWFLVSEMNFTWNGGGYGRVDFRYAHVGAGVSFIY